MFHASGIRSFIFMALGSVFLTSTVSAEPPKLESKLESKPDSNSKSDPAPELTIDSDTLESNSDVKSEIKTEVKEQPKLDSKAELELKSKWSYDCEPKSNLCHSAWAEGFVSRRTQNHIIGIPAYKVLSGGGAMGVDWPMCRDLGRWRVGIAVRSDSSDLDAEYQVLDHDLDFNSMRAIVYTRLKLNSPFYLSGLVSFAANQYYLHREVLNFHEQTGASVFADYDGRQWAGQFQVGAEWCICDLSVQPELSVYYSNLYNQSYQKITADFFNNQTAVFIPSQMDNALFVGANLIVSYTNRYPKAKVVPYVHAKAEYQTLDDSLQSFVLTTAFGKGTPYIYNTTPPLRQAYQLGAGIKVLGDKAVVIIMSYDYSFKPGEYAHSALLSIKHDW